MLLLSGLRWEWLPLWLFVALPSGIQTPRMLKISFTCDLEQWSGKSVYDAQMPGDLVVPTPASFEFYVDENAVDSDPASTRGVYTSPTSHVKISFGPFSEDHQGAIVEVWAGHLVGNKPIWGFFFRNKNAGSAYGVYRPAQTGIYAFYTNANSVYGPSIIPNDSLAHVLTAQGSPFFVGNTHAYHNGTAGYPQVNIHAEADNDISHYTAELLP